MITVVVLAAVGAALVVTFGTAWVAHRRRAEKRARRAATLTSMAERIDAAVASLRDVSLPAGPAAAPPRANPAPAAPLIEDDLPGRVGLVDAAWSHVAAARSEGTRLAVALVRASDEDAPALAAHVREIVGETVYSVGPRSVAFVLPRLGRAEALGVLARIEAQCRSTGRAVELEPDEDAVELVTRLLLTVPGGA